MAVVAAGLAGIFIFAPASGDDQTLKLILAGLVLCGGVFFLRDGLRSVDNEPGLVALADGGRDVVWLYVQTTMSYRYGKHTSLRLGLADGMELSLRIPKGRGSEFLRAIAPMVPHATIGYDPAYARQFASNPTSLRQA